MMGKQNQSIAFQQILVFQSFFSIKENIFHLKIENHLLELLDILQLLLIEDQKLVGRMIQNQ
ncbi:unnamed protein product [Paramecium octaurelia]|uniref:Uncharacterized protein n=1 Tax=Paramecium octaurelia TaxID=43137 RepID=A0A8S1U866_PAROT|nr:unnamed protein product [Paramecium octaurelia]